MTSRPRESGHVGVGGNSSIVVTAPHGPSTSPVPERTGREPRDVSDVPGRSLGSWVCGDCSPKVPPTTVVLAQREWSTLHSHFHRNSHPRKLPTSGSWGVE